MITTVMSIVLFVLCIVGFVLLCVFGILGTAVSAVLRVAGFGFRFLVKPVVLGALAILFLLVLLL